MLFNFRLTPVDKVPPWGGRDHPTLSWFGLTDGCYWLRVGEAELFRYREEFLTANGYDGYDCQPYNDYYVVRLWEDIQEILPTILAPVPPVLADKLSADKLHLWEKRARDWFDPREDSESDDIHLEAVDWYQSRRLYSGYLKHGPRVWFWSDGTEMHIEWDNREQIVDGMPVWEAQVGSYVMPIEAFMDEVRAFDRALIQAMQVRVQEIQAHWSRPEIYIDRDLLVKEQADRAHWLDRTLRHVEKERAKDWSAIIEAVRRIESETQA